MSLHHRPATAAGNDAAQVPSRTAHTQPSLHRRAILWLLALGVLLAPQTLVAGGKPCLLYTSRCV